MNNTRPSRFPPLVFDLPNGKTVTLDRKSKQYERLKDTLYRMRARCNNPKDNSYKNYGARGIKCYINSVEELVNTLGLKPKGYSIDRIDNDGDYTLDNIRWANTTTQQRNRSISYVTTINGETKSIYDWYELLNVTHIPKDTVKDRYLYGVRGLALYYPKYHPDVVNQYKRNRSKV